MARGLAQGELGVHRNHVGGVERAAINPTVTQLEIVAQALRMRPSEVLAAAERRMAQPDHCG